MSPIGPGFQFWQLPILAILAILAIFVALCLLLQPRPPTPPPIFQLLLQTKDFRQSTLGWPLRGPWVTLGWPKGHPIPIPVPNPIGRGSQNPPCWLSADR